MYYYIQRDFNTVLYKTVCSDGIGKKLFKERENDFDVILHTDRDWQIYC